MSWVRENSRFIVHFLKHPRVTGAILPSSRYLAARMISGMDLESADTVVEIGPGTGAFTCAIAKEINPKALFVAVELNPAFASALAAKFPAVQVVNDSAENLRQLLKARGRSHADSVLCSLPWAGFTEELQKRLLQAIAGVLRPGGRFSTYAYIHASWFPGARRFRDLLRANFRSVSRTRVVWRNLPPAVVYHCEK